MRRPALVAGVLASALVLAGCASLFGPSASAGIPDHIAADASDPLFIDGWAYGGENLTVASGTARIDVVNSSATGTVSGSVSVDGTTYEFDFEGFTGAEGKPSHANGINQDFPEHGDSGNGHGKIPELHAVTSGWGPATVSMDGAPVADPVTGNATLAGHFMLTDTGIRDDESRRILTADGDVYGPDDAGEGERFPGDRELHVVFKSPTKPSGSDRSVTDSGTLSPAMPSANASFPLSAVGTKLDVDVNVSAADGQGPGPSPVQVTFGPQGGPPLRNDTIGGAGSSQSLSWNVSGVPTTGSYRLGLQTQGTAEWAAAVGIDVPEPLFLHVLYETTSWQAG